MHAYTLIQKQVYKSALELFKYDKPLQLKGYPISWQHSSYKTKTSAVSSCSWSWKTITLQYAELNRVTPTYSDIQRKQ
jgi:hypothetical protein